MAGAGGDIGENVNGFSVMQWGESRGGGPYSSFTWQIQGNITKDNFPTILIFDAVKKTLSIDLKCAKKLGVTVEIDGNETQQHN